MAIPNKIQIGYIIEFTQNEIAQFIQIEIATPPSVARNDNQDYARNDTRIYSSILQGLTPYSFVRSGPITFLMQG